MSHLLSASTPVLLLIFLSADWATCQRYIVPEANLEFLSPRGLKISIPDIDKDVTLVAFHININEEFDALTHGHWAQDIIKKRDGRWSYFIPDFKAKKGDTIYYWIYVIVENLGYHGLDRVYKVTRDPHGPSSPAAPTTVKPRPSVERPPDRYPEQPKVSVTSYNGGLSSIAQQVIMEKHFNNWEGWNHEIQIGGSQPDDEFMVFTKDPATTFVQNNNLVIKPILLEEKSNDTFVRSGSLTLEGCTSSVAEQCSKQGVSYVILPPVMSARLTTRNSFTFRYGTVEIRAKLPSGDWIVPELWLEPKASYFNDRSSRIVCALSRGNTDANLAVSNYLLEAGLLRSTTSQLGKKTSGRSWSRDYHIFKLRWTQDQIVFTVDNEEISRVQTSNERWLEQEFYITLGVHAAGGRDFSDDIQNKPWKNTHPKRFVQFWESKNVWHPSWTDRSALRVDYVKVTAI